MWGANAGAAYWPVRPRTRPVGARSGEASTSRCRQLLRDTSSSPSFHVVIDSYAQKIDTVQRPEQQPRFARVEGDISRWELEK